ncbi:MAG TPA: GyrI-like domain-containing protein [Arthrobacter sp.]|nr:GyrI-like domain-containing protein [Arthrobacter sp.]
MNATNAGPKIIHTAEQPTAVVHEHVPMAALTEFFGRAFGAVMAAAQAQNVQLAGPPFALYRGMPAETVDVEAGFPVNAGFTDAQGVAKGILPEADAFEAIHLGPYDTLGDTYGAIQERMRADGFTPSDTMWEYYLSDPATEPDPATWQTRVVWPVA